MELFYRQLGNGFPIIILHGLYGMSDNWMSIARQLSNKYQIWLPDQRNHGRSPHSTIHTYQAMCNDLLEFIQKHQLHKPIVMGHSMGGKVAMTFAKEYPNLLSALVVVDIAPKNYQIHEAQDMHSHHHIIESLCSLPLNKIDSREKADELLSDSLPSPLLRAFLLKNLQRSEHGFQWLFNLPVLKENLKHIAGGFDNDWQQATITGFPVLFLKGEQSDYITPNDIPLIEQIFPAAQIEVIPQSGHWLHAQNPQAFIAALQKYLNF
ncbi:MAG: alpha/beta fold hydrolase [Bacteroidales bacterium]|nr:alpha/beta fold hydrolase [Bacteroidales bacterium]